MSFRIRRSREALRDIDTIRLYLAGHDLSAAEAFVARLDSILVLIADHPRIGRTREELGGIRGYSIAPYLILYLVDEQERLIDLERVLDGQRDIAALFGQ